MKILVIGGTGYIGGHTVEELVGRGHQVFVFARGETRPSPSQDFTLIKGDRHNPGDLKKLRPLNFDGVIDINAYAREETQSTINALDGATGRFVHLSTISVYQLASGMPLVEGDPLETDPGRRYGYNKAECERALRWAYTKNQFPYVAIRPPAVFGPRDHRSRENYYLERIMAGDPVILPHSGAMPIHAIYVKDLAAVLANALSADRVTGGAYHIAQDELVSVKDHISNIARLAGKEADAESIPARLLERLGFSLYHFPYYAGDALIVLDTAAAKRDLDFAPTPYPKALRETVKYFMERGPVEIGNRDDLMPPVMPRSRERAIVERFRTAMRELEDRLTDEWLNEALPEI